jgi:hypothetical protein
LPFRLSPSRSTLESVCSASTKRPLPVRKATRPRRLLEGDDGGLF